jgi:hypothetical protein
MFTDTHCVLINSLTYNGYHSYPDHHPHPYPTLQQPNTNKQQVQPSWNYTKLTIFRVIRRGAVLGHPNPDERAGWSIAKDEAAQRGHS